MVAVAERPAPDAVARGASVEVRAVSHAFQLADGPLPVLDDINLTLVPGEFVALLGPSGCGKSTLLRLLAGLEPASSGKLLLDGTSIVGPHPSRLLVFQDPTLFPWRTVRANVALGPEAQGRARDGKVRVDQALERVGLAGFEDVFPHQLSGGMAQRVALARALVNDPRLLMLDEPLGRLDSLTRIAMQSELVDLWRRTGATTLMVTHDVEEALFMANRVLVLSRRPARIAGELIVDEPYPRHRGSARLAELRHEALRLLGLDATW